MNYHNDPSDNIDDFLPKWSELGTELDEASFEAALLEGRRNEYAALADL